MAFLCFLQNITGFMVGSKVEAGGIAKDGANWWRRCPMPTFRNSPLSSADLSVPATMACGRAFGPRMMYVAQRSHLGDGGPQAAGVLRTVKDARWGAAGEPPLSEEEAREITDPVLQKYETEGSAGLPPRLWDDGVIDPEPAGARAGH